jgi:hypothetical protein
MDFALRRASLKISSLHQSLSVRRAPSSGKNAKWKIFKLQFRKKGMRATVAAVYDRR